MKYQRNVGIIILKDDVARVSMVESC